MTPPQPGGHPRSPFIVHERDLAPVTGESPDGAFVVHRKQLGRESGGRALGCGLIEVPPGKKAWPHHYHWANEEAMYVLSGEGTVRLADGEWPIAAGDYVTFLRGPEGVHQVRNTGEVPLRFLMLSTMVDPDVCVYPDSEKIAAFGGSAPGGPPDERRLHLIVRTDAGVPYWAGEGEADT